MKIKTAGIILLAATALSLTSCATSSAYLGSRIKWVPLDGRPAPDSLHIKLYHLQYLHEKGRREWVLVGYRYRTDMARGFNQCPPSHGH